MCLEFGRRVARAGGVTPARLGCVLLASIAACGGKATLYENSMSSAGQGAQVTSGGFSAGMGVGASGAPVIGMGGSGSVTGGAGSSSSGVAGGGELGGAIGIGGSPPLAGSGGVGEEAGESGAGTGGQSAPCPDTDCGGSCPACTLGEKCLVDADCASDACDAVTRTCIADQCADHRQDGLETDADCGGATCPTCAIGKACGVDSDCTLPACDGISQLCVNNTCADHRRDFNETDVDCGGGNSCLRCKPGLSCNDSTDCRPGHVCSMTSPHVCL